MTAIRYVLEDVAAERYVVPARVVAGLAAALDVLLAEMPSEATCQEQA